MSDRRFPTLRAIGPTDDPDGFPVVTIEVDEPWLVQTDGMRASDVADTISSKRLAFLFAAAPDLLSACEALLHNQQQHQCAGCHIEKARAAVFKARNGGP